jgi:Tfp pilus assembly protein PilO
MNKLSKEKRQQLVLVVLLALAAVAGIWFGLIKNQQSGLKKLSDQRAAAAMKFEEVKRAIANADQIETQATEAGRRLATLEEGMASGDLYAWMITAIREFKLPYKVEIPQFSALDGPKEMTMLAQFPYKQASITIIGTAGFYDLGRFIADFENQHPYMRILNLSLEPASTVGSGERERLAFRMEIVALVKPGASS